MAGHLGVRLPATPRWWWWWCGRCVTCGCLSMRTHNASNYNGLAPVRQSLRLDWPASTPLRLFPPKADSRRPQCKPQPTLRRGKRLRGTPTSLPTPSEEGGRNLFHLLGVGCPGSGSGENNAPGRVFLVSGTLLPKLLPSRR